MNKLLLNAGFGSLLIGFWHEFTMVIIREGTLLLWIGSAKGTIEEDGALFEELKTSSQKHIKPHSTQH